MIDWITGEKFVHTADLVYYPKGAKDCNPLVNTYCPCALKERTIIYTHTMYVHQLFDEIRKLKAEFVIVTHNCDANVDDSYNIPDNVVRWFTQNVDTVNPKVESIPIGLENDKWFKAVNKKTKMEELMSRPHQHKNLVYLNSNVKTNPQERQPLYDIFSDKHWVTTVHGINGVEFDTYLENIHSHPFVFCPDGNGIDTHRLWETLYMGSIPIVKRGINTEFYKDFPICYVDNWGEVTQEFLHDALQRAALLPWYRAMLEFEYWKNKIRSYVSN
jgi:hypothetical protein